MKNRITVLALTIAFACSAHATSNDNNGDDIVKELYDLRAGLHDVHMNTLQKYSESWGLEDRANIAKMQETKLDKSVFTADQARQDKALADSITKQAATDSKQTSDLKSYADKKADSAYSTSVAHTDSKVARADADRAKGDAALQSQITGNLSSQSDRDAGQDNHINAVQEAAQSANEKADAGAVRADGIEQRAIVTDDRSIHNAVRLDGVEQVNGQQEKMLGNHETRITQNSTDIVQLYSNGEYAQSRIDAANANIQGNRDAINSTNRVVSQHSAELANHEQRIGDMEKQNASKFANIDKRFGEVKDHASAGTASAFAQANIPQVMSSGEFGIGAGVGTYSNQQAVAVGASYAPQQNVVIKATVSTDTMHNFGAGAGMMVSFR